MTNSASQKNSTTPHSVTIYTDGSCLGNPGPGGWAAKIIYRENVKTLSGGFKLTTNNRMEVYSAIVALQTLTKPCIVNIHTDSRYLCDAVKKGWLTSWQARGWKKADKKPVLNQDLWEKLLPELTRHQVQFFWVEGHAGHADNEEVDTLARTSASQSNLPPDLGYQP